jgi:RNA polymerase sigma factor (sigma-70 family)
MSLVSDHPADKQNGVSPAEPAPDTTPAKQWVPTEEAFNKLLALFSSDRDEAGKEYEKFRIKLIRYFEWRGRAAADILADKTLDRVMMKLSQGEEIKNPKGYIYSVAKYILQEDDSEFLTELTDELSNAAQDLPQHDSEDNDPFFRCLEKCLNELPPGSKKLILTYYQEEKRTKIDGRRQLAEKLGIPINALRIRAHRIRKALEKRIHDCISQ